MYLDTRGFTDGFAKGFGMMEQYKERQRRNRMEEQRLQAQKEQNEFNRMLAERRMGLQEDQFGYQKERDDRTIGLQEERLEYEKDKDNRDFKYRVGKDNREHGLATQRLSIQERQAELAEKRLTQDSHYKNAQLQKLGIDLSEKASKKQRTEDENYAKSFYSNLAAGQTSFNDETIQRLSEIKSRNPDLIAHPILKTIDERREYAQNREAIEGTARALEKLFTPNVELDGNDAKALAQANVDVTRAAQPQAQQAVSVLERVFNPNDDFNENSPEALQAFNYIFADMVGQGKRIAGVYPGRNQGTIVLDLDTETQKGVPMTAKRGTAEDGDDEVLEIPVEKAMDALTGFRALAQQFSIDEDARNKALRFSRNMGLTPKADKNNDFDTVKFRTEVMSEYRDSLDKIMNNDDLTVTDEAKQESVAELRNRTARILGIHPSNFDTFLVLLSRGQIDDEVIEALSRDRRQSRTPPQQQPAPEQESTPNNGPIVVDRPNRSASLNVDDYGTGGLSGFLSNAL